MFNKTAVTVLAIVFLAGSGYSQEIGVGKDGNIRNVDARAMIIKEDGAYLATRTGLYRSIDIAQPDRWEEVFLLPPGENEITALAGHGRTILLGTRRGLFRSDDGGQGWRNVFRTIIPEKNNILSIDISRYNPKKVVISTVKGLFLSEDFGLKWQDISANLRNKRIKCAALNKDVIYAAGGEGLYIRKAGEAAWERIYVDSVPESAVNDSSGEAVEPEEAEGQPRGVNCVTIKKTRVYIGVDKAALYSDDEGKSWRALPGCGPAGIINHILVSRKTDSLYCATTRGVFEFDDKKNGWSELYKGTDKAFSITSLLFCSDDEKALWSVAEKGLYKMEPGRYAADQYIDLERNLKSFRITFDNEPTFRQLQQAAIKFSDVSPDKIRDWHRESRLKAMVPKVSVGMGNDRSSNTEIYTSATRDYAVVGPEDYSSNLDFSVSWDLGNLIWSDDQTNIDVRSRLNTQLRNDILDDLRRAYYERKRLQFELIASPPKDSRARFERELRIQELTQAIDDLTGNYLSDNMKKEGGEMTAVSACKDSSFKI